MNNGRGDKLALSSAELSALESRVLPAARRWLRMYPGLAHHAVATLTFWGEQLADDHGRPYDAGAQ